MGAAPFVATLMVMSILLVMFPNIALWLPILGPRPGDLVGSGAGRLCAPYQGC